MALRKIPMPKPGRPAANNPSQSSPLNGPTATNACEVRSCRQRLPPGCGRHILHTVRTLLYSACPGLRGTASFRAPWLRFCPGNGSLRRSMPAVSRSSRYSWPRRHAAPLFLEFSPHFAADKKESCCTVYSGQFHLLGSRRRAVSIFMRKCSTALRRPTPHGIVASNPAPIAQLAEQLTLNQ